MNLEEQLKKSELPVKLLQQVAKSYPDCKTVVASAISAGRQVILVTGGDSPLKEGVIASIMREVMVAANVTGRWVPPTKAPTGWQDDNWPNTGVIAVPCVDALSKQQQHSLATAIRSNLPKGKYVVLGCFNWQNLSEYFGSEVYAYIRHYLLTYNVKSESPTEISL